MKRLRLTLSVFLLFSSPWLCAMKRVEINFSYVDEKAKALSERKYRKAGRKAPQVLQDLAYDEYREITFINDKTLWFDEDLAYQVQFLHLGYLYDRSVGINEYTATHSQRIPYVSSFFEFDRSGLDRTFGSSLGYAGFRLLYPIFGDNLPHSEFATFLGASYFRCIGKGMRYGLSARGLAINSGLSTPEEFPRFIEFWLGKPISGSRVMQVYALLDSPSVSGAYEFEFHPGDTTKVDIKSRLYFREDVESLGVAPLTSMYWYGENSSSRNFDYRPEVHDSDGLLIDHADGEVMWRPLDLDEKTRLSFFDTRDLKGFGLFQRDSAFSNYQDLEARYHLRPSVWVKPKNDWDDGRIKLIELPTKDEFDDNIIAFWEPKSLPKQGESLDFEYSLFWTREVSLDPRSVPRPVSTRIGKHTYEHGVVVFVVDFLEPLASRANAENPPAVNASVANANLKDVQLEWNPHAVSWRATMLVTDYSEPNAAIELRCQLDFLDGESSEVWSYQWTP